ncbi:MAG: CRISPR-associated helicase Cas3' [candidate division WOR-3 bacterium]|nr:CRISPR-associated helicase Cas3' [candidate division WOR-3 bacterium]
MDGMKFYSHKGKLLIEHLRKVSENMVKIYDSQKDFIDLNLDKEKLREFIRIVGMSHDFGKYTTFFQKYLMNGEKNEYSNHSLISALFCAYWLENKKLEDLSLFGYIIVKNHHGELENYSNNRIESQKMIIEKQIDNLKENKDRISEELGFNIGEFLSKELADHIDFLNSWDFRIRDYYLREDFRNYFLISYVYSLLLDCDRRDTIDLDSTDRSTIESYIVNNYIRNLNQNSDISQLRKKLYQSVVSKINNSDLSNKILSINAPTGLGKTLINLKCALLIREKIQGEGKRNYIPRIIYSLPFINIVEQTYEVFCEVLEKGINDFKRNESRYIIKHHHLSEIDYKSEEKKYKDDNGKSLDEGLMLIESWDSEIIVTTFVQLLYSIIGYKKSFLKKFHNIVGSIIILDEVQSIDIKYWKLIENVIKYMSKYLGCYFIISTATKPLIFNSLELVENYQDYILNRTKINIKLDINSLEQLKELVLNGIDKLNSHLIVFNTIKNSIDFYQKIKTEVEKKGYKLFYLSTNIIPKHRRDRINKLKDYLKKGEKVILVSTQVVEAGVDLDFDIAYRDLGPLDSIIQVAGRVNRNNNKNISDVFVFKIKENGTLSCRKIYGFVLTDIVEEILKGENHIEEKDFYKLIQKYYEEVQERKQFDEEILKALEIPDFEKIKKFKIIEDKQDYIDVFVEVDDEAKKVFEKFIEIYEKEDFIERYKEFLKIKKEFFDYVISIPKSFASEFDNEYFPRIKKEDLENFYDKEYGFKRFESNEIIW